MEFFVWCFWEVKGRLQWKEINKNTCKRGTPQRPTVEASIRSSWSGFSRGNHVAEPAYNKMGKLCTVYNMWMEHVVSQRFLAVFEASWILESRFLGILWDGVLLPIWLLSPSTTHPTPPSPPQCDPKDGAPRRKAAEAEASLGVFSTPRNPFCFASSQVHDIYWTCWWNFVDYVGGR